MSEQQPRPDGSPYKDRTLILSAGGALMLLAGVAAALFGPVEVYCFYLFSEGGRFHYQGFGFGSLMFGIIAWQIIGYYAIAILLIPLGYGHVRLRRWARMLTLCLLYCGLIVGLPLMVVFVLMLSVKDLSSTAAFLVVAALATSCLLIPGLLIRFYQSQDVRQTFEARDKHPSWIESLPVPVLVLAILFVFYLIAMHAPLFYNGIFPLFGIWLSGVQGFLALDVSIVSLAGLAWGVLQRRAWAWWLSLGYFCLLALSSVVTLLHSSFADMLSPMRFPARELEILQGVPLQGADFVPIVGIPLGITLGVIIVSKRYFGRPV